ncbi:MAG: LPS export ABC transporter permease LptG [Alphaproteobacteria bacterium]|nr:LPS export ABC transporter permease LptG [Alphaproteobacteria bacterium]
MKLSVTMSAYIGRRFAEAVLLVLLVLLGITSLISLVELIRRAATANDAGFGLLLEMSFLKAPILIQRVIQFAVLIGGMLALMRLTRTHELIVARAAGVSVWQFLAPGLGLVFCLGLFTLTVVSPLASMMLSRYEQLEARYFSGKASMMTISSGGLWLRQVDKDEKGTPVETVVHALRISQKDMEIFDVIVFRFGADDRFLSRVDARTARLEDGTWHLRDALLSAPGKPAKRVGDYVLKTSLTLEEIQNSFAAPETLSFWQLPGFIHTLEQAGFSALRHRLYFHSILSLPVLLCSMLVMAASFSLRMPRRGGVGIRVVAGVIAGFVIYFLTDLVFALGQSGTLPAEVAAWTPAFVTGLFGVALLLHLEDG